MTNNSISTNLTSETSGVTTEAGEKSCTLRLAGNSVGRGDHQFRVIMYPNSTEVSYGVTSEYTDTIKIGDPSAELKDCPTEVGSGSVKDGYIREGTNATCTCTRTDQTFFPVNINWRSKNGGNVSAYNQQPQSTTLTFTASRNQAFTCSVTNSLQVTKEVTYKPQVAYGPSNGDVTLEPPSQGTIDLCQAGDETFTVQCQVSASDAVPNAAFSYTVNTTSSVVPQTPAVGITSSATITVTQGGTYGVYCMVKNSVFPDIQAQNSVSVVVREPPSAPIIEISQTSRVSATSGDKLTVEEGGANVMCHVIGGYPPQVRELRLSCGMDVTFTNPGNQAQMSVTFTRNMNGQSCSCVATHDSTCYSNNTVSHLLNVLYPPSVKTFSVGNLRNVTVERDSSLTFVCEAEGNPGPELSLQHDGAAVTDVTTDGDTTVTTLRHNLTMDCLDTGVYTCTAQAQEREDSSTVEVFVLCPQQLKNSQIQNSIYFGQVNSTFSISVPIYGYPKPTSLQLHGHKEDLQQADYFMIYAQTRPPHGIVTLTFYTLTEKYFQNYTLNVTNTRGSLVYNFSVGKTDSNKQTDDVNVGAIVGGVIAGVVVILVVVLAFICIQRRGKVDKKSCSKNNDNKKTQRQELSPESDREPYYESIDLDVPTTGTVGRVERASYANVVSGAAKTERAGYYNYQGPLSGNGKNEVERISRTSGTVEYENTI